MKTIASSKMGCSYSASTELEVVRVAVVGLKGVGKTSIVKRLVGDASYIYVSKLGIGYGCRLIDKKGIICCLELWDINTDDVFNHHIIGWYIKNMDVVLFVFALDDVDSLNGLDEWIVRIRLESPHAKYYLIGNKCDVKHTVDKVLIARFKIEKGMLGYYEVSAKKKKHIKHLERLLVNVRM
jgi:GTPase SAR1 family protein